VVIGSELEKRIVLERISDDRRDRERAVEVVAAAAASLEETR